MLFIPRLITRLLSFFGVWFNLVFSRHGTSGRSIKPCSLDQNTEGSDSVSAKSNVGLSLAPSSFSFSSPTTKHGVTPTQQQHTHTQQISEESQKTSHSIFFTLTRWIPFVSSLANSHRIENDPTNSNNLPVKNNDDVLRDVQSPYHPVDSSARSDSTLNHSPLASTSSITDSKSGTSTPIEKPKTRQSRKNSSSSTRTRPSRGSLTNSPSKQSKDQVDSPPAAIKKRKSPIAYAFRFPRIYAPPRPLLPPLAHKSISFWDLFSSSSRNNRNAALVESALSQDNSAAIKSKRNVKHTRASSSVSSIASIGLGSMNPLPTSSIRMSSNVNAIHNRRLKKKTLVLDLDETLIHSLSKTPGFSQGQMVEVKFHSQFTTLYTVLKRPFCDEFLDQVSQWYNLVIFTASVQAYADPMIDWLERDRKYFVGRYYRQHCTQTPMGYVKDLEVVDTDLSSMMIIDNSPISYTQNESNGIGIEGWINDPSDTSLMTLIPFLSALRFTTDVRSILGLKSGDQSFQ